MLAKCKPVGEGQVQLLCSSCDKPLDVCSLGEAGAIVISQLETLCFSCAGPAADCIPTQLWSADTPYILCVDGCEFVIDPWAQSAHKSATGGGDNVL